MESKFVTDFLSNPDPDGFDKFYATVNQTTTDKAFYLSEIAQCITSSRAEGEESKDITAVLGRGKSVKLFYIFLRLILSLAKPSSDPRQPGGERSVASVFHMKHAVQISRLHALEMAVSELEVCEKFMSVYSGGDIEQWFTNPEESVMMSNPTQSPKAAGSEANRSRLMCWLETPHFFHLVHYVILMATTPAIEGQKLADAQTRIRESLEIQLPIWLDALHSRYQFCHLDLLLPFYYILNPPISSIDLVSKLVLPLQSATDSILVLQGDTRYLIASNPLPTTVASVRSPRVSDMVLQHLLYWAIVFRTVSDTELESMIWMAFKGLCKSHTDDKDSLKAFAYQMSRECTMSVGEKMHSESRAAIQRTVRVERAQIVSLPVAQLQTHLMAFCLDEA